MAIIKEFREFFLRNTQVNSGSKPDKESNFIVEYYVNSKKVFNRFLKGNYPSEAVHKKLFESITFKLNLEDTADNINQGLVRLATDNTVNNRTPKEATNFATVVSPEQLSDVKSVPNELDTTLSTESAQGITVKKVLTSYTFLGITRTKVNFLISLQATNVPLIAQDSVLVNLANGAKTYVPFSQVGTIIPTGTMMVWNSITPPAGWYLANGANGTVDMSANRVGTTYWISKI